MSEETLEEEILEAAKEFVKLGYYISLAGPVTFKNARVPKEVAEVIDIDHLLVETDDPYLTPHPYRGKRNEPKYLPLIAEEMAKIKNVSVEKIATKTFENACEIFGVKL